jgi:SNF family Na+-dependent transporter
MMKSPLNLPRLASRCAWLLRAGFATAMAWLGPVAVTVAQAAEEESEGGGDYALPYALVILGIGLGLLVVCRESGRRDRAKPEQYGE